MLQHLLHLRLVAEIAAQQLFKEQLVQHVYLARHIAAELAVLDYQLVHAVAQLGQRLGPAGGLGRRARSAGRVERAQIGRYPVQRRAQPPRKHRRRRRAQQYRQRRYQYYRIAQPSYLARYHRARYQHVVAQLVVARAHRYAQEVAPLRGHVRVGRAGHYHLAVGRLGPGQRALLHVYGKLHVLSKLGRIQQEHHVAARYAVPVQRPYVKTYVPLLATAAVISLQHSMPRGHEVAAPRARKHVLPLLYRKAFQVQEIRIVHIGPRKAVPIARAIQHIRRVEVHQHVVYQRIINVYLLELFAKLH